MTSPPASLAAAITRELQGERVLWAGMPERWGYIRPYWTNTALGIPFLAFAVFWTYQASQIAAKSNAGFAAFFPLWGLIFVAAGLSMLLSPLWAAWLAGRAYYVVTERRAIIVEKGVTLKIRSLPRSAVAGYERVSRGGSAGSIIFKKGAERWGRGMRIKEVGFIGLPDYASAERALNTLIAS